MSHTLALLVALSSAQVGGAAVGPVLGEDAYQFCHDERYPLLLEERGFCPLVGERSDVCPALPKACAAAASDPDGSVARRLRARPWGSGDAEAPPEPPEPWLKLRLPEALSGLAMVVFFALVAAGAAIVGWLLWKVSRRKGDARDDADEPEPPAGQDAAELRDPQTRAMETDVGRLLSSAEAAAARGDYDRALAHAHAALLRRLEGEGLIELHPWRTNGDHVRALRGRAPLQAAVRDVCRDVERAQFGAAPATQALYRSVYTRVVPLATRALGAALLGLLLTAGGASCHGLPRAALREDTSPSGTRAIGQLLSASGVENRRRTRPLSALGDDVATLVLLRGAAIEPGTWEKIFAWVRRGGVLVAAGVEVPPEWTSARRFVGAGEPPRVRVFPPAHAVLGIDRDKDVAVPTQAALRIEAPAAPHAAAEDDEEIGALPLLQRARGPGAGDGAGSTYAVYESMGDGAAVIFADGALFTNIALTAGDNGAFLVDLLASFERPVELCDRWTGAGASTPIDSLREAHLTPVLLQLFALAALLLLWKGRAFGALRDPPAQARRAFVDHVRALGHCYGTARAAAHVSGLYAGWALDRLRERVQRRPGAGILPLAEAIAVRTGRPEREIVEVLVEAQGAREPAGPPSTRASRAARAVETAHHLDLMRRLDRTLAMLGSGRGRARGRAPVHTRRAPEPGGAAPPPLSGARAQQDNGSE
ncbi:hypothetical protein SOCE26_044810 [Sorangium cellulosum]|uniref:DUF4350 domain-containing protein n=1 Tax=Sorangium cellulosum TaxID=56 RepID=A0A2L0EUR9_SORCE|nr:DUF4350 domain-containing protein [Sorangium cellulosum]AUX43041.1 hypothetical protein SOCE26_044810 [Sorangium cellulosum]